MIKLFSTTPTEKDSIWQIVLLPTISIVRKKRTYTVINLEWLFWNLSTAIDDKK